MNRWMWHRSRRVLQSSICVWNISMGWVRSGYLCFDRILLILCKRNVVTNVPEVISKKRDRRRKFSFEGHFIRTWRIKLSRLTHRKRKHVARVWRLKIYVPPRHSDQHGTFYFSHVGLPIPTIHISTFLWRVHDPWEILPSCNTPLQISIYMYFTRLFLQIIPHTTAIQQKVVLLEKFSQK